MFCRFLACVLAGLSLCYVRILRCVLCSLQPRPRFARARALRARGARFARPAQAVFLDAIYLGLTVTVHGMQLFCFLLRIAEGVPTHP